MKPSFFIASHAAVYGLILRILLVSMPALIIAVQPAFAGSETQSSLRAGAEIDFLPYSDADDQGHATGFAVELLASVAAAENLSAVFQTGRWESVWDDLKKGKIDALPLVAHLPERENLVEFTEPHTIGYDSFFVRNGQAPIKTLEQARVLSIIVLRADAAYDALSSRGFGQQLVLVNNLADAFRLLASGQHDAILAPYLQGNFLRSRIGLESLIVPGPLLKEYRREFCFAVQKGNTALRDRLNQGIALVKASGEYDRLYRKWLGIYEVPTYSAIYVGWGVLAALTLLALMGLWTWQLRRQVALRTRELTQAHLSVQAERQRLLDVLQALPVYVILLSPNYQITFANRFFEQRYGKAQGRPCQKYVFNNGKPCETCEMFKVLESGASLSWNWSGPDGHDYEIHDFPFSDSDGTPLIMEVGIDITEMNRAKQALKEVNASLEKRVAERTAELAKAQKEAEAARDLLQVTMDNAPALMSYIGRDYRYRRINKNYELWFGLKPDQLIDQSIREVHGEAAWHKLEPYLKRTLTEGRVEFEIEIASRDGLSHWVHCTYSPDLDTEGRIGGFVGHILPIGERKRAEAALQRINSELEQRVQQRTDELRRNEEQLKVSLNQKEVLLKEIHHRVKNNLQIIASLLKMQSDTQSDPKVRDLFMDSTRRLRSMALIHEQLYKCQDLKTIDFADYIAQLAGHIQRSFAKILADVTVRLEIPDLTLNIDHALPLGLIVNELVSNCYKHAFCDPQSDGEKALWVKVALDTPKGLVLEVGDSGCGIPEEVSLDQLSSMGLQLVRSLVMQLNGRLTVQSNPGCRFLIEIPGEKIFTA